MIVEAQSSYNNDYGYNNDDDLPMDDNINNSGGGYAPQPPSGAVDNLYYDYAARQEAKEGLLDGTTGLGGGAGNGYVMLVGSLKVL